MNIYPYLLLGESHKHAFADHLTVLTQAWSKDWCLVAPPTLHCRVEAHAPSGEKNTWFYLQREKQVLVALQFSGDGLGSLAELIIDDREHANSEVKGELAQRVMQRALQDYLLRLLLDKSVESMQLEQAAMTDPTTLFGANHAYTSVSVVIGTLGMTLLFSAEVLKRHLPKQTAAVSVGNKLAPLHKALGKTKLKIDVHLGDAVLKLSELNSLSPGDVVQINRQLSEPLQLRLGLDASYITEAYMGSCRDRVAVYIVKND